jgi:hypothetical protein
MRYIKILLIMTCLIAPSYSAAEHAVGVSAGAVKGVGLTYRNINESTRMGVQITGIPVIHEDGGFTSGGVSALYMLHMGTTGKAFLSFGSGVIHAWDAESSQTLIGIGPGIGFEFQVVDKIGLSIEVPIVAMFGADTVVENNIEKIELVLKGVLPIPSASLVYKW